MDPFENRFINVTACCAICRRKPQTAEDECPCETKALEQATVLAEKRWIEMWMQKVRYGNTSRSFLGVGGSACTIIIADNAIVRFCVPRSWMAFCRLSVRRVSDSRSRRSGEMKAQIVVLFTNASAVQRR